MSIISRPTILLMAAVVALSAGCASNATMPTAELRQVLAPTGKLRVGLYPGTPTSYIRDNPTVEPRGVGYDLGKKLAKRLGVPYEPVVFSKNAEVLEAVKTGAVDVAFTNATAARAKDMDFTPPYLDIELGYLVTETSGVMSIADIDLAGIRVGVTEFSSSDAVLSRDLKNATIVRASTVKSGVEMLTQHRIDAYATNKPTLFEMADALPGSRVLDGCWGVERQAIAIPRKRDAGMLFLRAFVADAKEQGLVKAAVRKAGLRGSVELQ